MAEFTKGPWEADLRGADAKVKCPDGRTFMIGDIVYHDENKANARLIAASPDLLAAIKALLAECDPARACDPETGWFREVTSAGLAQARAAISKAEGRS